MEQELTGLAITNLEGTDSVIISEWSDRMSGSKLLP